MTVSVNIDANANGITAAFEQIRAAIKRAGQEGKDFAKLDLSHPELKNLEQDIRTVQRNFDTLRQVGRGGVAAAVRQGGFTNPLDWYSGAGRMFPNTRDLERHMQMGGSYVLRGTSFEPRAHEPLPVTSFAPLPAPAARPASRAPAPARRGGGESGGGGLGGLLGSAIEGAAAVTGFLFAAASIGGISGMAKKGLAQAEGEDTSNDALMRRMGPLSGDFNALRTSVRQVTDGLQLTYGEAQRLSLSWAKLTNEADSGKIGSAVRFATGMARGYGMDPGATVQGLGQASYLGEDPRRFALMIGEAVNQGHQTGQTEQVMSALLSWSQAASRFLVTGTDVAGFASMYSGLNATGLPGFKGQNAASLIAQINQSVMQGGAGGDASQALTYRAFASHGITDPYQIQFLQAGGMFSRMGRGGPTVFEGERAEINKEYAGLPNFQRWMALSRHFGINPRQAAALDHFRYGQIGTSEAWLQKSGIDLSQVNPSALRDIGGIMGANEAGLQHYATAFRRRTDVPAGVSHLLDGLHGDPLREQLVRLEATYGMQQTEGTKLNQSLANMSNALTELGTGLIPVVTELRDATARLVGPAGRIATELEAYLASKGIHLPKISLTPEMKASSRFVNAFAAPGARTSHAGGEEGDLARAGKPDPLALGRERQFYNLLTKAGMSSSAAIGYVAMGAAESGMQPHPKGGDGRGFLQWHRPRIAEYEAWAARTHHPAFAQSTLADQEQFSIWEATSPDSPEFKNALKARAARSGPASAKLWSHDFIRPAGGWDTASIRADLAGKIGPQIVGGTPLPTLPGGAHAPVQKVQVEVSTAPLQVQHIGPNGALAGTEYLPTTHTSRPVPAGSQRDPGPLTLGALGVGALPVPPMPPADGPWAPGNSWRTER